MTEKQKAILDYIGDHELIKKDIVNKFLGWYHCNQAFHIGSVLSRMVKAGILERPRHGVYRKKQSATPDENDPQLNLF